MLMEDRSIVALVRSPADLERACQELAGLLSAFRRRGGSAAMTGCLLGIWMDERGGVELPPVLELGESAEATRPARIVEATGVSGIWMMYFLEAPPRTVSRTDLLGALVRASVRGGGDPALCHFIPVFARDRQSGSVQDEMQRLERCHPGLLLAPLHQDPHTGVLDWPPESRLLSVSSPQRASLH